jgi:DNA polymerase-3 subunit chi
MQKKSVLVYAVDTVVASGIDRLLWTHSALSFVPHCRADSPLATETPILITDKLDTIAQDERLMNLSQEIPPGFSRFQSLIEVVGQDEIDRTSARDRVKFYKDRGYEVRYFDLSDR